MYKILFYKFIITVGLKGNNNDFIVCGIYSRYTLEMIWFRKSVCPLSNELLSLHSRSFLFDHVIKLIMYLLDCSSHYAALHCIIESLLNGHVGCTYVCRFCVIDEPEVKVHFPFVLSNCSSLSKLFVIQNKLLQWENDKFICVYRTRLRIKKKWH